MSDSVTYKGKPESLLDREDVRARLGERDVVDVWDEQYELFVRVDEGDKLERFGKGWTVVRKSK